MTELGVHTYPMYLRLHVHVTASNLEVIRRGWARITAAGKVRAKRKARHAVWRSLLGDHRDALALFHAVAMGI